MWGSCIIILDFTYKSYILPLFTNCSEPMVAASNQAFDAMEKFHKKVLRLIKGAEKTTKMYALLKLIHHMNINSVMEKRSFILWEKIPTLQDGILL